MINYRFSTAPMRSEDRFINPLGFQVYRYRRDQEAVSAAPPPPTVAPATGTQPQVVAPGATPTPGASPTGQRLPDGTEVVL